MKEFIEKLIKELYESVKRKGCPDEACWEHLNKNCNYCDFKEIKVQDVIEIVNQLAEEYNDGWIPVDKTLPKKSGYYTVTEEQYSLDMRRKIGVRVSHEVQFDAEEQRWYRAKFLKVIAWKEHETPYQPKGE